MPFKLGDWAYHAAFDQPCQVIEARTLWGETTYRVWLAKTDRVVQVAANALRPLAATARLSADAIIYRATAARIAAALASETLLAPLAATVVPLPHQLHALARALAGTGIRYLLADEVGLGKTIEAGLVLRELKLRGLVRRVLVVAPKGLTEQWVAEMQTHFGEVFTPVTAADLSTLRSLARDRNPWALLDQVVCSMDAVKPIETRRGWSRQQVEHYNRDRFDTLLAAGWDLVIVDEAHRLGGSTDQIARYRLGQGLAAAAPYLLLLSATPHQGKSDAFRRILNLLDEEAFPDDASLTRARVQPYVIRTEKRQAIDAEGQPLFRPRLTRLLPVTWEATHPAHDLQSMLYAAVTDYVRVGYNRALAEQRNYIGFLLLLLQRLVSSSTAAIRTTLERRLAALGQDTTTDTGIAPAGVEEEWQDLDGQEQADIFAATPQMLVQREQAEVTVLLELARQCERSGPDAKATALLNLIYDTQQAERDAAVKVLVFTEFVPTQAMLHRFLEDRGFIVAVLNGSMDLAERQRAQQRFAGPVQVLISTDAGGEGINLQFCHVVVNYDIPWNPMRIEQRIGRVDRIGQAHTVYAHNLVLADTVEHRVCEVLEEKLALIRSEFGIDKTGDVLDSGEAGALFEDIYLAGIIHPNQIDDTVERVVHQVREQAQQAHTTRSILGAVETLDATAAQRVNSHPLPTWTERLTVHYVRANGGIAQRTGGGWLLEWPGGTQQSNVAFRGGEAAAGNATTLTLEEPRIRALVEDLAFWAPAAPLPIVRLAGLPAGVTGLWSLWRIELSAHEWRRQGFFPLFVHDDGRILAPTARRVWDLLLVQQPVVLGEVTREMAAPLVEHAREHAEAQGQPIHQALRHEYQRFLTRLREKTAYAFTARRRAVDRIGLMEVRLHRQALLRQEEAAWEIELEQRTSTTAALDPLLLLRVAEAGL